MKYLKNESNFTVGFLSRYELINTYDNRHIFDNLIEIDPEKATICGGMKDCQLMQKLFQFLLN